MAMTHTLHELREYDLFQAADVVWRTVLGLPLTCGNSTSPAATGAACYTAWVAISDLQRYAIYAVCDRQVIRQAAAIMFGDGGAQVEDGDLRDALGELANQIAGELTKQNLLPAETGLPHIERQGQMLPYCQKLICAVRASCESGELYFAVCHYSGELVNNEVSGS